MSAPIVFGVVAPGMIQIHHQRKQQLTSNRSRPPPHVPHEEKHAPGPAWLAATHGVRRRTREEKRTQILAGGRRGADGYHSVAKAEPVAGGAGEASQSRGPPRAMAGQLSPSGETFHVSGGRLGMTRSGSGFFVMSVALREMGGWPKRRPNFATGGQEVPGGVGLTVSRIGTPPTQVPGPQFQTERPNSTSAPRSACVRASSMVGDVCQIRARIRSSVKDLGQLWRDVEQCWANLAQCVMQSTMCRGNWPMLAHVCAHISPNLSSSRMSAAKSSRSPIRSKSPKFGRCRVEVGRIGGRPKLESVEQGPNAPRFPAINAARLRPKLG